MVRSPNNEFTLGVAVFVKTPGRSPLKTRLAKTVGTEAAQKFYKLACNAIADTLLKAQKQSSDTVQPVWAVAENDADIEWPEFQIIHQGTGELGEKLHHVYDSLLKRYSSVALIGADAPQISVSDILLVKETLKAGHDFVVGPARDGGFYLFAGRKPIDQSVWMNTPYSQDDTLERLLADIQNAGSVAKLHSYTDVDTFDDLKKFLLEINVDDDKARISSDLIKFVSGLVSAH